MKILFVDDARDTRELYQLAFRVYGHDAHIGANGQDAVEAVRQEKFDVMVIDIGMPLLNGWDAVRAIRLLDNGERLPIIVFTAYADEENVRLAREVGADLILPKPVMPNDLMTQINELVGPRNPKVAIDSSKHAEL